MDESLEVSKSINAFINGSEYELFVGKEEWLIDLDDFEQCIFLDLIDNSEAE